MHSVEEINKSIKGLNGETNDVSDGYHTFGELYDHRIALFKALCSLQYQSCEENKELDPELVPWKSKKHSDGTEYDGWFICGIGVVPGGQISYHLPLKDWDQLKAYEYDEAPEWDGHTAPDVIERLKVKYA